MSDDCAAIEDNICLEKGSDYIEVEWIVDDDGNPVDISADTFRAEVREYAGGPLLASFTFEIFLDTSEATPFYKYRRKMAQTIINPLTVTEAKWDQFRELADGSVDKNFYGLVSVPANITNPTVTP